MDIPAIYCVYRSGAVRSAPVRMEGTSISFESEPKRTEFSAKEADYRVQILAVDMRGLARNELDSRLLTNMEFPGCDVWFLTCIKDIEDVFDSFIEDITKVLIPYHSARNDLVLKEAYDMSENCIPLLFVSKGKAICRKGEERDVRAAAEDISRIGFWEIAILDTDSSLTAYDWSSLHNRFPGLIPFVRKKAGPAEGIGFERIIFDL